MTDFDPQNRDENVDYYTAKLDDLVKKFSGLTAQLASTSSRIWLYGLLNSAGSFFRGFDADGEGRKTSKLFTFSHDGVEVSQSFFN